MDGKITEAAAAILRGELVGMPTETVYGLAGNALDETAVARIYAVKGRPHFNPLIVHVHALAQAEKLAVFSDEARRLAAHFWPGPLTLVLPRRKDSGLSLLLSAGLETVALRMPNHPLALHLLEECGVPLAAPSANRSGKISPTDAAHVAQELGDKVSIILDGGACRVGLESTVVNMTSTPPQLLRPGGVTSAQLAQAGFTALAQPQPAAALHSPGMLASHYAPGKPVRLNAQAAEAGEALLGFGPAPLATLNLSHAADTQEAAANLFRMLRALDAMAEYRAIAVMPIPNTGLGSAINDRLMRAAHRE